MKVRMLEGFYGREEMGSDSDYYLAPVSFPMRETLPDPSSPLAPDVGVTITNEEELEAWASEKFVEHNVWDMEVPDPLVHVVMLDRTGAAVEEIEYVGAFYHPEQANLAEDETRHKAHGEPFRVSLVPFGGLDEWREDAAARGVLGDDDRETGT